MADIIAPFGKRKRNGCREGELRRLAIQLAAQLPSDPQEALDTLEHAKTLVRAFLSEPAGV